MRPRHLLAALTLAACFAAPLRPAAADTPAGPAASAPRIPAGWVRGGNDLEPLPHSFEREPWFTELHRFSFRTRNPIPGAPLDLGALPVTELQPSTLPAEPPAALPPGSAGDVVVLKKGKSPRVTLAAFESGVIQVGQSRPTATGRQSEGGAVGVCGTPAAGAGLRPLRYDAVRRIDKEGNLELVWARGFLDAATCAVSIVERASARPKHIAGGVVYAFRTRCAGCAAPEREVLHVLTPDISARRSWDDAWIPFEHRTLPLLPGRSAAFEGMSSFKNPLGGGTWALPDWEGIVDRKCKQESVWCAKDVRLEVSWAAGEPAPTAFLGGDLGP